MIIKEVQNINLILEVHKKIYLNPFPLKSLESKKERGNNIINYEFWEDNIVIGYCIIIDKKEEKTLHAWVGGIIPQFQGKGYFSEFYDWLKELGKSKKYKYITGNTDNYKFNIIRMMIKKGFYILSTGKSNYGDGIKIYLRYDICEERSIRLSLTSKCNLNCFFCHHEGIQSKKTNKISIPEIERILCQARRLGINEITLTGGEPFLELDKIIFILKYCSSWDKLPVIKIVTNSTLITKEAIDSLKYKGQLKINLSLHSIKNNVNNLILGKDILLENYKTIIKELIKKDLTLRINTTLLKDINSGLNDIKELLEFLLELGVKKLNLIELLITKEQENLYKYYLSNEEIEKILIDSISGIGKYELQLKNEKKIIYKIFIKEKELEVSIYRLSCRCGCKECYKNNDITIGSEAKGYPCYLEPNFSVGNALESLEVLINQCDTFTKSKDDSFSKNFLYWGDKND